MSNLTNQQFENLLNDLSSKIHELSINVSIFDIVETIKKFQNENDKLVKKAYTLIKRRIAFLKKNLKKWEYEYYGLQSPTVSDTQYDLSLRELKNWETCFPQFASLSSPTKKVGGAIDRKFKKATHSSAMLSLDNAFSLSELQNFDNFIKKTLNNDDDIVYNVEPKFDGLSVALIYQDGNFFKAITRGNGIIGEDVTKNINVVKDIPKHINTNLSILEVRGEIYLDYEQFGKINNDIEDESKKFANPRNAASGTLRRLDQKLVAERELKFVAYYIPDNNQLQQLKINSQNEIIHYLKSLGFRTSQEVWKCSNINEAYEKIKYLETHQDNLPYPIDGGVLKVDDISLHNKIGATSKFPHWAIAYKFIPKEAITKVLDIIPTVGRTGKITYVAKLSPIHLSGSTISSATLNNAQYIQSKDIRIGDYVKIFKAAEIIPYVKEAIIEKREKFSSPYLPVLNCPVCGSKLERRDNEVDQYCVNTSCKARILQSIIYFCSKKAMNIEGISEKTIKKYYDLGFIKTIPDIYHLNAHRSEIIKNVLNNKFKVFNEIIEAIEKSKSNSLERLINGLGIRDVGYISSLVLAKYFKDIDNLMKASKEELINLKDIGDIVSSSIYDWTHNQANINLINQLKALGINTKYIGANINEENKKSIYYQKNICITGSFDISREEIKEILERKYDIHFSNSLNKSTDYLIVGNNAGTKIEKAKEWNIPIITNKIWED